MIFLLATTAASTSPETSETSGGAVIALFVVIAAVALWVAFRAFIRSLQAKKTETAVGVDFTSYALQALVNAAKLDGRVNDEEKRAIVIAMREIGGEAFEAVRVEEAFAKPGLNKDELIAFLASRGRAFTRDQKVALLKALMAVFVSDGHFQETEHSALIDYTAAIGFDRQGIPEMLRGFARGSIT